MNMMKGKMKPKPENTKRGLGWTFDREKHSAMSRLTKEMRMCTWGTNGAWWYLDIDVA